MTNSGSQLGVATSSGVAIGPVATIGTVVIVNYLESGESVWLGTLLVMV